MSPNALAEIATNLGTEPVVVLEIQWTEGGSLFRYSDVNDTTNRVEGRILDVSGLDNVITISGVLQGTTGESLQLGVVLDDRNGSIKSILDQNDVHKRDVFVYQWFPNLDYSDKFLLFKGQVSSPLEWHEGDRTIRFDVINKLEDNEVGFSVEEGDIEFAPDSLYGKPWPFVFGTEIHVPALKLRQSFSGILRTGFGIRDFTLVCKLDQLNNTCCPLIFAGWRTVRSPSPPFSVDLIAMYEEEPGCKCRRFEQKSQWEADLTVQSSFELSSLTIINGELFPQAELITLDICGSKVTGRFTGTTFAVSTYTHPEAAEGVTCPPTKKFCGTRTDPTGAGGGSSLGAGFFDQRDPTSFDNATGVNLQCGSEFRDRANVGWDYLSTFPTADFFWAEPGCEVFLDGDQEIVYVVNLLPSTILRVAAYRTFESGVRELVTVPPSLYTARISDFNGYMVTELVFQRELSRRGEGWEDDIFVSQTSSVGPNTVNVIEYLIGKYTSFTTDTASFNSVRNSVDNYPAGFWLEERRNIFDVLKDIAFQARCALYLRNDVFTLRYLPAEPASDFTITENDVLPKSMILTHTETEELVTKFVAEWKSDEAVEEPNRVILKYNVKRYGIQEKTFNFFLYNIHELVEKSATFWLIRMANTWRRLILRTPINKLQSEVFDLADVTLPDFSSSTIKALVEKATYDSDNHEIQFEFWTPVRAGETEPFVFAWPGNIEIDNIWPTLEDQLLGNAGGSGPNVNVKAPALHPLTRPGEFKSAQLKKTNCSKIAGAASTTLIEGCRSDHGDKRPSDQDDEKPTKDVPGQGETDIPTSKNPTGAATTNIIINNREAIQDEADNANDTARNELANDGSEGTESGNPPIGDPAGNLPCPGFDENGNPIEQECRVRVIWREISVTKVLIPGEGVSEEEGAEGLALDGIDSGQNTLYFDNPDSANAAAKSLIESIPTLSTVGQSNVIPGTVIVPQGDVSRWSVNNCDDQTDSDNPQGTGYCPGPSQGNNDSANDAIDAGLGA